MVMVSAATDVMEADANAAADTPENPAIAAAAAADGARFAVFDENGHRYTARRALWSLKIEKIIKYYFSELIPFSSSQRAGADAT